MKYKNSSPLRIPLFQQRTARLSLRRPLLTALILFALSLSILAAGNAYGHRLNVFAWEEGGNIIVESNFGAKRPARNAAVTAQPANSAEILVTGETDAQGRFVFPVPANAESGLVIIVNAGQGHQGRWEMAPLRQVESPSPTQKAPPLTRANNTAAGGAQAGTTASEIRPIIREELAKRSAPPDPPASDPGVVEIIGGLGWIVGLFGIFLWVRSLRKIKAPEIKPANDCPESGKSAQK